MKMIEMANGVSVTSPRMYVMSPNTRETTENRNHSVAIHKSLIGRLLSFCRPLAVTLNTMVPANHRPMVALYMAFRNAHQRMLLATAANHMDLRCPNDRV